MPRITGDRSPLPNRQRHLREEDTPISLFKNARPSIVPSNMQTRAFAFHSCSTISFYAIKVLNETSCNTVSFR